MACWFSFSLFLKISAVTYTTVCARAYGFVFERHQRSDFFVEKLYGMRARALGAVHAFPRARGAARDGSCSLSATRRQRRKVDKCRVADKKKTDKPTDKHTLLFYRYRFVRPTMEYSFLTWMGASESSLNQLNRGQHRALRLMSSPTYPTSVWSARSATCINLTPSLLRIP